MWSEEREKEVSHGACQPSGSIEAWEEGLDTYRRIILERVLEERSMLWSACRSCEKGNSTKVVIQMEIE